MKKLILTYTVFFELFWLIGCANLYYYSNNYAFSPVLRIFEGLLLIILIFIFLAVYKNKFKADKYKLNIADLSLLAILANYRTLYFYTKNIEEIPFSLFILCFLGGIFLFCFLFMLFRILSKNKLFALFGTFLVFVISFCTENLNGSYIIFGLITLDIFMLLQAYCLLLLSCVFFDVSGLIKFLSKTALALIIISLINCGINNIDFKHINKKTIESSYSNIMPLKCSDRDIYVVLLDMYAGNRTLLDLGFDNSDFIKTLEQNGFAIYKDIYSNYSKTLFSVPSFLNGDYVEKLNFNDVNDSLNNSLMFRLAEQCGYKLYFLKSYYFSLDSNKYAKSYDDAITVYYNVLDLFFSKTLFSSFSKYSKKASARENFVNEVIRQKEKKFVFLHYMMPHYPYMYDENGNPLKEINNEKNGNFYVQNNKSYVSYLRYANKYVLSLIDKIFSTNIKKPIIIVMGDHGIRPRWSINDKIYIRELEQIPNFYFYVFNTFVAYYNPDIINPKPSNKINSLVNFSRSLMNDIWGINFKQIKDKRFYVYYEITPSLDKPMEIQGKWVE